MIYLLLFYISLIVSLFIKDYRINSRIIPTCIYFLIKWWSDNDNCTITYAESKIRKIPIENTFVFSVLNEIKVINKTPERFYIYAFTICVILINIQHLLS